jgi:choline kinase
MINTSGSKVFIPCAGLGSRAKVTMETLPKPLITISGKPLIARVIEQYEFGTEFVIALGFQQDLIKQFLDIYSEFNDIKITYTYSNSWEDNSKGLTNTLIDSKDELYSPFIFNACDTLILDDKNLDLLNYRNNTIIQARVTSSGTYKSIINKQWDNSKHLKDSKSAVYVGVSLVYDYENFWKLLLKNNRAKPEAGEALGIDPKTANILEIEKSHWLDCGSPEGIELARQEFENRDIILLKDNEATWNFGSKMLKIHTNSDFILGRILRAETLKPFVPQIERHSQNIYTYNRVDGETLSKSEPKVFKKFLNFLEDFWFGITPEINVGSRQNYIDFYKVKTINRLKLYDDKYGKLDLQYINGEKVKSMEMIINELNWDEVCTPKIVRVHGDLHPDNVIYNKEKNQFTLLDWRQDIATSTEAFGDLYYDIAKINHGLILDHELMHNGNYKVSVIGNKAEYYIELSDKKMQWQNELNNFIESKNFDYGKVKVLTGLIFINIAALHHYPYSNLLFILGQEYLSESLPD